MPSYILHPSKSSFSQSLQFRIVLLLFSLLFVAEDLHAKDLTPVYNSIIKPYYPKQLQQYGHVQLALKHSKKNPDSTYYHTQQAIQLSVDTTRDPQVARAYSAIGFIHKAQKKHTLALDQFYKAYRILRLTQDRNATSLALINMGDALIKLEKDSLAIRSYAAAFEVLPAGYQEAKAMALTRIAKHLPPRTKNLFQIGEALRKRVIEIHQVRQDTAKVIGAILNLGNFYTLNDYYLTALQTFSKVLLYKQDGNFTDHDLKLKQSIGVNYLLLGDYPKAKTWLQEGLRDAKAEPDPLLIQNLSLNLGYLYFLMDDTIASEKILRTLVEGKDTIEEDSKHAEALCNLGIVILAQGKFAESKTLFLKAKDLLGDDETSHNYNNIHYNLGLVYAQEGDYKTAGQYYQIYADNTYDSHLLALANAQKKNIIQEATYITQARQKDLDHAAIQSQHQRQLLLAALLALILFSIIIGLLIILLQQRSRTLKAEREKAEAAQQQVRAERQAIEAQHQKALAEHNATEAKRAIDQLLSAQESRTTEAMMDGIEKERQRIAQAMHDSVGMMLSTIKLYLHPIEDSLDRQSDQNREQFAQVLWLIDKVMEEVRRISHNLETTVLRNFGLPAALNDLRETIRKNQTFDFDLIVSGFDTNRRLPLDLELQALRIMQELVGNAMKYAQAKTIIAQAILNHNSLHIEVYDDGLGFDAEAPNFKPGLGLRSIEERLKRWHGTLDIDSGLGNGTTINVEIQLPHPNPSNP